MHPSYQQIVAEALAVARLEMVDEESTAEAVVAWEDGAEVVISKNEEGGFLSVALTVMSPAEQDAADVLLEKLLRLGSETVLGDVLVGGCRPDRRLMLAAMIPLVAADEAEIDRRLSHLALTVTKLEQAAASPVEVDDGGQLATTETAGWMRI
ncbi:MAG: hypothetical protein ACO1TE_00910 [Prosthecobacter sp.]